MSCPACPAPAGEQERRGRRRLGAAGPGWGLNKGQTAGDPSTCQVPGTRGQPAPLTRPQFLSRCSPETGPCAPSPAEQGDVAPAGRGPGTGGGSLPSTPEPGSLWASRPRCRGLLGAGLTGVQGALITATLLAQMLTCSERPSSGSSRPAPARREVGAPLPAPAPRRGGGGPEAPGGAARGPARPGREGEEEAQGRTAPPAAPGAPPRHGWMGGSPPSSSPGPTARCIGRRCLPLRLTS